MSPCVRREDRTMLLLLITLSAGVWAVCGGSEVQQPAPAAEDLWRSLLLSKRPEPPRPQVEPERLLLQHLLLGHAERLQRNLRREVAPPGGDIEYRKRVLMELYKFWLKSQSAVASVAAARPDIIEP